MAEVNFGIDFSTFAGGSSPDLDPTWTPLPTTSTRSVAESIARGLFMPHGRLVDINDSRQVGVGIIRYLSMKDSLSRQLQCKHACEFEALQDERVKTATATVTFDDMNGKLKVRITGESDNGPFELVVLVGLLTTELLKAA